MVLLLVFTLYLQFSCSKALIIVKETARATEKHRKLKKERRRYSLINVSFVDVLRLGKS